MPVLGTLPDDKRKLIGLYAAENSKYQTNLSRLDLFKTRAQNPQEPADVRAEARAEYNKLKKVVDSGLKNLDLIKAKINKLEGGKELTKIQEEYKDLLDEKSLLIDPNDPRSAEIDAEIEKLVKPFQNAYSKVVGARISETVARTNLLGKEIPTFGRTTGKEATAAQVAGTPTPTPSATPEVKPTPTPKEKTKISGTPTPDKTKVVEQPPLDTQTFEPTVTIGGAPAGYVPSEEMASIKASGVADIAERYGLSVL